MWKKSNIHGLTHGRKNWTKSENNPSKEALERKDGDAGDYSNTVKNQRLEIPCNTFFKNLGLCNIYCSAAGGYQYDGKSCYKFKDLTK